MLIPSMKYPAIIFLFFAEFFSGCDSDNPVSSKIKIDPDLIGVWYSLDTMKYVEHEPVVFISGIRFSQNGTADFVGVETATGNLAVIGPYDSLLQASNGIIILRRKVSYFYNYDTLRYKIGTNVLDYTSNRQGYPRSRRYLKGDIGRNVFHPINSNFKLSINGVEIENRKISNNVSAYVSNYDTNFSILVGFSNNWFLNLTAKQILAAGSYIFNHTSSPSFNSIELHHNLTDELGELYSTDSTFTGKLEITDFNIVDGSIKGNIIAQLKFSSIYVINKSLSKMNFVNMIGRDSVSIQISGNFELPVY